MNWLALTHYHSYGDSPAVILKTAYKILINWWNKKYDLIKSECARRYQKFYFHYVWVTIPAFELYCKCQWSGTLDLSWKQKDKDPSYNFLTLWFSSEEDKIVVLICNVSCQVGLVSVFFLLLFLVWFGFIWFGLVGLN